MKLRTPSHATVVAYLALFTALAGSAYAASKIGTNDLKHGAVTSAKIRDGNVKGRDVKKPIVRVVRRVVPAGSPNTLQLVQARCKKGERLIAGGGGWDNEAGTITFSAPDPDDAPPAPVADYVVRGRTTATPNAIEARALCVPR
jgi:hypothetical protein